MAVGKILLGRPQFFVTDKEYRGKGFFQTSKAVRQLKPTAHNPLGIVGRVQKFVLVLLSLFIRFQHISGQRFRALALDLPQEKKQAMLHLFERCLQGDGQGCRELTECRKLLDRVDSIDHCVEIKKKVLEKIAFRKELTTRVQGLKAGEKLLLPATRQGEVNVFYLLERTGNTFTLKLIGCDQWFSQATGETPQQVGGKERILSQMTFKDVPKDFFTPERVNVLFCQPLLEKSFNAAQVRETLAPIADKKVDLKTRDDLYVMQGAKGRKALGLVAQELSGDKGVRKRLEFQTRLLPLFDFYKQVRFDLSTHAEYRQILRELVQEVAKEASLLGARGYFKTDDLAAIQKELTAITETLNKTEVTKLQAPPQVIQPLTFSLGTLTGVQAMTPIPDAKPVNSPRQPLPLPNYPINKRTLLTDEELAALEGEDAEKFATVIRQKREWIERESKEEVMPTLIALITAINPNKNKWISQFASAEKALAVQEDFLALCRLVIEKRKESVPFPYHVVAFLKLMKLSDQIDRALRIGNSDKSTNVELSRHFVEEVFDLQDWGAAKPEMQDEPEMTHSNYFLPEELVSTVDWLTVNRSLSVDYSGTATPEIVKKGKANCEEQRKLFSKLLGVSTLDWFHPNLVEKAFKLQQLAQWSKPIHPLLGAALRGMELKGHLPDARVKLWQERKWTGSASRSSNEIKLGGWNATEIKEAQKDYDRTGSLKLPEAAHDNPWRVLQHQLGSHIEKGRFESLKKEEVVDLICLLRREFPQLEAVGFLKAHPHLLSHPDVRNFLEVILFSYSACPLKKTVMKNEQFFQTLPDLLLEELNRYPDDLNYKLFMFSCIRRTRDVYRSLPAYIDAELERSKNYSTIVKKLKKQKTFLGPALQKLDAALAARDLEAILADPKQKAFHFRACFELLSLCFDTATDVAEIACLYQKLLLAPTELHDVNPAEMDQLRNQYWEVLLSVKGKDLSPLLDQLVADRELPLDQSAWQGEFPVFYNGQYTVDLTQMEVAASAGSVPTVLPPVVQAHPLFQPAFGHFDKATLRVTRTKVGETMIYTLTDQKGHRGRVESEGDVFRFYRENYQVMPLKEGFPLKGLTGDALLVDPEHPHEACCLDANGKKAFKILLKENTIVDCRKEEESAPYQCQTVDRLTHTTYQALTRFEDGKEILVFARQGKVERVEFLRYGLSFVLQNGKLLCEHPRYRNHYIDLNGKVAGVPFSLVLKPLDVTLPTKVILTHPSVLRNEVIQKKTVISSLNKLWMAVKTRLSGRFDPELLRETELFKGPKSTDQRHLTSSVFELRPYTNELVLVGERIPSAMALAQQAFFAGNHTLALRAIKMLQLTERDLTRENLTVLLRFIKKGEGNSAVKICLALELHRLMGKKVQFAPVKKRLAKMLSNLSQQYLRSGRKIDQTLLLNKQQFESLAVIVKKTSRALYDRSFRLFFLKEGQTLPKYTAEGNPDWDGVAAVDHKANLTQAKEQGQFGIEEIPLYVLEERIQKTTLKQTAPITLHEGVTLLKIDLKGCFHSKELSLPEVHLPQVDHAAPSCEKKAVEKLEKEMEVYKQQVTGRRDYLVSRKEGVLLKKRIISEKEKYQREAEKRRQDIEDLLSGKNQPAVALAILGGIQKVASFKEASLAFLQGDLASLKLPEGIDREKLKQTLQSYFEAELRHLLLHNALAIADKLAEETLSDGERSVQANLVHQLLTMKRQYKVDEHPELLVYECFTQQIFRQMGAGKGQIELLQEILAHPNGVFQAVTGAGKTTVLSLLRGLLQANGTNLVSFRLLPTLYEQSKAILQKQLGGAFEKKIYCLQFDLKQSIVIREKRKEGVIEESLFKKIYHEMLKTISEKGCLITDYKSLPLLQEKWLKLNRELLGRDLNTLNPLEVEHWHYLRKILLLLHEREETMMDEFDVPNRSCNRLLIPMGDPIALPEFFSEVTLALYDKLRNNEKLQLAKDQQRDLTETERKEVIHALAREISKTDDLYYYFIGKKECDFSSFSDEVKDSLALVKDQITTFLPLTLKKASGLDYQRSKDGKRTVPAHEGEAQENSRFGHPLEEINYTVQDYIQNGVSLPEFERWLNDLQQSKSATAERQFQQLFPKRTLTKEKMSQEQYEALLKEINGDWEKVKYFLELKLKELTVSGEVVSMTPHDMAAMPRAVAGLSATLGCPEELPSQLKVNADAVSGIMGEMVYRLLGRTGTETETLEYDAEKPFDLLDKESFQALIDGAGAFRAHAADTVAEQLLEKQTHLKQVGYNDGKPQRVGKPECTLSEKGYYFTKAKSRGADIPLHPEGTGLLTVDGFKTLEDLAQNDGRMRLKGQKIRIARSKRNPDITNTEALLVKSARNEGQNHAAGLFRSKMQEIPHRVRQEAYLELLKVEKLDQTLAQFAKWQDLFIQKPPHDYTRVGSYFHQNQHISQKVCSPKVVLEAKKEQWQILAQKLGLTGASLKDLIWDETLIAKMPAEVAGPDVATQTGLEVQEEVEVAHEVEAEMDVDIEELLEEELRFDQCGDVPYYPSWIGKEPKEFSAKEKLHDAFDPRIVFTQNFLPLEREDQLFKRTPFDHAMPKAKTIHIVVGFHYAYPTKYLVKKVILGDVLDDVYHRPHRGLNLWRQEYYKPVTESYSSLTYDLRTNKQVDGMEIESAVEGLATITAQVKFLNGDFEGYTPDEWAALLKWLKETGNPKEMSIFFEKNILRTKPQHAAAYRVSDLHRQLQTL
ncbi:MAG: DUF3638 domain-containing protein [Chlamydiia bacterium]|nr:DUF3638 domain-containing protein [Chlamydiia bacterium]